MNGGIFIGNPCYWIFPVYFANGYNRRRTKRTENLSYRPRVRNGGVYKPIFIRWLRAYLGKPMNLS